MSINLILCFSILASKAGDGIMLGTSSLLSRIGRRFGYMLFCLWLCSESVFYLWLRINRDNFLVEFDILTHNNGVSILYQVLRI